jgi:hypothetical protein
VSTAVEALVGARRRRALPRRLLTRVTSLAGPLTQTVLSRFTAVVATRGSHSALCALNDACRAVNVPFILASARGLFGCVFCDFGACLSPTGAACAASSRARAAPGATFTVHDARVRAPATYSVESITQARAPGMLLHQPPCLNCVALVRRPAPRRCC